MNKRWKYLGLLMIFLGLFFILLEPINHFIISRSSKNIVNSLDSQTIENNNNKNKGEFNFHNVDNINSSFIFEMSNIEEEKVIGIVSIPEVDMDLPIFKGLSNANLMAGAGTMKENQQMGEENYALAGHNWRDQKTLFSPLHRVKKGMMVYLTDLEDTYKYKIDKILMVPPERVDIIEDADESVLTFVTCNYNGTKRLIVQGSLIDHDK